MLAVRLLRGRPDVHPLRRDVPRANVGARPVRPVAKTDPDETTIRTGRAPTSRRRSSRGTRPRWERARTRLLAPSARTTSAARVVGDPLSSASASPRAARADLMTPWSTSGVLPSIRVPTLVCTARAISNRASSDRRAPSPTRFGNARSWSFPGIDHALLDDPDAIVDEVERFLTGRRRSRRSTRCSPRSCSPTSSAHPARAGGAPATARGTTCSRASREVAGPSWPASMRQRGDTAGDGFFATFDGPAGAFAAPARSAASSPVTARARVRAGCTPASARSWTGRSAGSPSDGRPRDGQGRASEVLVSQTVKDLVAGSGIDFEDRGAHELKGVPGEWRLYSVAST